MFLKHKYPARVSGTASAGERTWRSLPDSSVGKVPTPTGTIRFLTNSPKFSNRAEKTVEVTFHTCGYKKSLRNFFKSGGFNQNGGYLLSHCDAVPSA